MEVKVDCNKIRKLRLQKSWSQEELADTAGLSLRTVQRMEYDGSASLKSRRAIAEALGVEPDDLDPDSTEENSEQSQRRNEGPSTGKASFWSGLLSSPYPKIISGKVHTLILFIFWMGMMVSGGVSVLALVSGIALRTLYPEGPHELILVSSLPLFVVFFIFLGIYFFLKKAGSGAT